MKEMVYRAERTEPEILFEGEYKGHAFAIISHGIFPTAYAECKLSYCFHYDDPRLRKISVHGGINFYDEPYWLEFDDGKRYSGWDYANSKKQTTEEIYEEVKSVIDQLITVESEEAAKC